MAEHVVWGPRFGQYSQHWFERRMSSISDQEADQFHNAHGVPHLAVLEKTLHELSCSTCSCVDVKALLLIIWKYANATKVQNYSLLNYYYGFVCLRILIYFACHTVLTAEDDLLGDSPESSQPSGSWDTRLKTMAYAALDRAGRATQDQDSLTALHDIFTCSSFLSDPSANQNFRYVVSRVLWRDRGMFFTLCLRGLLPGCSLLLFATTARLKLDLLAHGTSASLLQLQDLGFRLYLAGSHRDRQVLLPVCMASTEYAKTYWSPESNRFVNSEDSRAVSHAYLALLFVWRRRGWSTKSLPIGFVTHLAMFILYMSGSDPAATVRQRIAAADAAFTFLWLVFEDRGRIPLSDHVNIRYFILPAVIHLQQIQERISTRREQRELAQMLVEVDFTSLVGRVLLLVSDEGNEFQDTECFDELTGAIYALQDVISKSASISPELFIDSKIEWGKAFIQLGMWRVWGRGTWTWMGAAFHTAKITLPQKNRRSG